MYDYVIVGAGSAGCVLAHRLTEEPTCSVLLLESGGADTRKEFRIPAAFSTLLQSAYDWSYYTEEQEQLQQRNLYIPRGKVLGGSSSINTMIYTRGNRYDYDHWCALGNQGWSYAEVLPYFKKAEHQERGPSPYHGVGGPLSVADLRCVNPLTRAFMAAGVELGWSHNADFNGAEQEGVGVYQVTQKRGQRHSAADAYLKPAWRRRSASPPTWHSRRAGPARRRTESAGPPGGRRDLCLYAAGQPGQGGEPGQYPVVPAAQAGPAHLQCRRGGRLSQDEARATCA